MTLPSSQRSPSLADVIRSALAQDRDGLHTMLPGKVMAYDPATQKADIKPLLMNRIALQEGEELVEALPMLPNVPVMFPRAGGPAGFFISFPIAVNDHVMLVFSERSLDKWLAGIGADTDPDNFHRHDISDAVAIPGLWPFTKVLPAADVSTLGVYVGKVGGPGVHCTPAGVELGGSVAVPAATPVALAPNTEARITALEAFALGHTHPFVGVAVAAPGITAPAPGAPTTTGPVAATKVFGV